MWIKEDNFFQHFCKVLALPHFFAELTFGDTPIIAEDRRTLAKELGDGVAPPIDWSQPFG